MVSPEQRLKAFQTENHVFTKEPLSFVVQFTRLAENRAFPLRAGDFRTGGKGQIAGLGGANLRKILKEYGIHQQLSAEGGRTSRGNMGLMIKYVEFLNAWNEEEAVDFQAAERYWVEQVREYFGRSLGHIFLAKALTSRRKAAIMASHDRKPLPL